MKILHVVPAYYPAVRYGGPTYSVHGLCKSLVKKGHDIYVYTTNIDGRGDLDVPVDEEVDLDGVKVYYFPVQFPRRLVFSPLLYRRLIQNITHFDIVHIHAIYLFPTWAAARISNNKKVPYVIAPRGMMVKKLVRAKSWMPKTLWLQFYGKNIFRKAAGLHFTTTIEKSEFERFGFKTCGRKIIIPNGLDIPQTIDPDKTAVVFRKFGLCKPYVLSLGRINWKKGLARAIDAWSQVSKADLVIAGNDEEGLIPKLQKQAHKLGFSQRVKFIGPVHGDDKLVLFNEASCFILPSLSENFGNVVLEAMAATCPVVVTPEVGASELILKYGGGLVVDGAPEVFGDALQQLLSNPEQRVAMGIAGRKAVSVYLSWASLAGYMEAAYLEIVRSTGRTHI